MTVDVNINLSRWPTRRLPFDETPRLVDKLRRSKVTQAWASSFDSLLHNDIAGVNTRLADQCHRHGDGFLIPFGSINPLLPDWREDTRRCVELHHMPGIRLHPNYHGYTLDHPVVAELLSICDREKLIVQLVVKMEDERTQHPLLRVPAVDVKPLTSLLATLPNLKVVLLNSQRTLRDDELSELVAVGQIYCDISMLEGVGGIARLLKIVPLERMLFGSHFPFFVWESAWFKLQESELANFHVEAICRLNARQLLSN